MKFVFGFRSTAQSNLRKWDMEWK